MVRLPRNEKQTYRLNSKNVKCDHQVWPWPWPWPWIFKVKYGISYISVLADFGLDLSLNKSNPKSAKSGPIATKRKANVSIELQASNVTNWFDLHHNLDLWILKVKCDLDLWPRTWTWPWIFMVKFWNSCISEWEGWFTLHKGLAVGHSWPWPFGDQDQVYGFTRYWPGWLQLSACHRLI